jgi:light-regulated signal transduction histidine kinase (bacteriophytochrome)
MVEYKPIPSDGTRNVIISDSVMIERAVSSFIQFALKNNDGVNPIILASDVNSSKLTVSVSFSGNRFDEKYVSSMFEFGTDDNRDNIGLYKVKLIADMLGGAAYTDSSSGKCIKLVFEISVLKDGK